MLLRHKVITLTGMQLSRAESSALFKDLIAKYAGVFMSVSTLVFDLAPYLHYLSECVDPGNEATEEMRASELLAMFDTEAAACGED